MPVPAATAAAGERHLGQFAAEDDDVMDQRGGAVTDNTARSSQNDRTGRSEHMTGIRHRVKRPSDGLRDVDPATNRY
jgi:hypothetical protein